MGKKYLAMIIFLVFSGDSNACSPNFLFFYDSIERETNSADFVFLGKVARIESVVRIETQDENGAGTVEKVDVHFNILKNWKGEWGKRPLRSNEYKYTKVDGTNTCSLCGCRFFEVGNTYIVLIESKYHTIAETAYPYERSFEDYIDSLFGYQ